jgi:hypothetical protein
MTSSATPNAVGHQYRPAEKPKIKPKTEPHPILSFAPAGQAAE